VVVVGLLALAPGAGAREAAGQSLFVNWLQGVTINVTLPDGTPVTAGSVIPAGTYSVVIYNNFRDDESIARMFHLSGPGVNVQTDLNQGEMVQETWAVTFQPSSTYSWDDDYRPAQVAGSFRTSSTVASSSGGGTTGGSTGGGASGTTGKPGATTSNADVAGTAVLPFRGALDAIVTSKGKLTLSRLGKKVAFLKRGRYTFSVDDESKASGFTLQVFHGSAVKITTGAFVGSHDVTLTLKPGRWFFFTPGGVKSQFFVTS
jgi:hypothetical protein